MWETLLQEVEVDSAVVADIANCLNRQVSRPMIDGTFHRKLEARKIFQHREQLENALEKASQQLDKVRTILPTSQHVAWKPKAIQERIQFPESSMIKVG